MNAQRRPTEHGCWGHLHVAALWTAYGANLGTLLRTCDATGACLCVPHSRQRELRKGNTLQRRNPIHWADNPIHWLEQQKEKGWYIYGVEIAEDAIKLGDLPPARQRSIIVLGHEHWGIPAGAWDLLDTVVEIPMVGHGSTLNVAVAGSLVLYRLAGLV